MSNLNWSERRKIRKSEKKKKKKKISERNKRILVSLIQILIESAKSILLLQNFKTGDLFMQIGQESIKNNIEKFYATCYPFFRGKYLM